MARWQFTEYTIEHILLATLGIGLSCGPVLAATPVTSTVAVSSTIQATCLNTTTDMAFGVYTGALATSTATITITCTNTTPYTVSLSAGVSSGATETGRKMTGPTATDLLAYVLTSDAAHSVNWGTTTGTVAGTGNGTAHGLRPGGSRPIRQARKLHRHDHRDRELLRSPSCRRRSFHPTAAACGRRAH